MQLDNHEIEKRIPINIMMEDENSFLSNMNLLFWRCGIGKEETYKALYKELVEMKNLLTTKPKDK